MSKRGSEFFLVAQDVTGWKKTDDLHQQQKTGRVPRGTLVKVESPYGDGSGNYGPVVKACGVSDSSLRMSVLKSNLVSLSNREALLLLSLEDTEQAYRFLSSGDSRLKLKIGDTLLYKVPDSRYKVPAVLKFLGLLPSTSSWVLGLEVTIQEYKEGHEGCGAFRASQGKGVFAKLSQVEVKQNSEERESSNCESDDSLRFSDNNRERVALHDGIETVKPKLIINSKLMNNNNNIPLASANRTRNVESIAKENYLVNGSAKILTGSSRYEEDNTLTLKNIHSHLRKENDSAKPPAPPSHRSRGSGGTGGTVRRAGCSSTGFGGHHTQEPQFSWDPNSRDKSRERRDRKGTASRSRASSRASSVARSSSVDIVYEGSSPLVSEAERWGPCGTPGLRPASAQERRPSPSPPPPPLAPVAPPPLKFVDQRAGAETQVGVGSMVQLETEEGDRYFGVVRYLEDLASPGARGRLAGIELEDEVPGGGDGRLDGKQLFPCPPGKAVFLPSSSLAPDPRFKESLAQSETQDFGSLSSPCIPGHLPPHPSPSHVASIAGRNKGIQGHQNSCYLDATLFSMFCFSSAFDALLYRPRNKEDIPQYEEVQRVLREEIVNPLRHQLYVRADRVMSLRTLLDSLSTVTGLTDQEKDPEEFLSSLLSQVLRAEPFLELSSGQTAFHYQLFVEKDPKVSLPTVQSLFDQSFNSSRVKLRKAPSVLILQMPRFGRQFKVYDQILPTQLLDVTDIIEGSPRQCVICGILAEWECAQCFGDHDEGLASTAFCSSCSTRTHQHPHRSTHRPESLHLPPGFRDGGSLPLSRVFMELTAVVCIETSHYVSFVRAGDSANNTKWCFFDSMADRLGERNGYNIPELLGAPELEHLLTEGVSALQGGQAQGQAKRVLSDAYLCFYQSNHVTMYR